MPTSHKQKMEDITLHLAITSHHKVMVAIQTNKILDIAHHGIIRAPALAVHGITEALVLVGPGTIAVLVLIALGTTTVLVLVAPGTTAVLVLVGPGTTAVLVLVGPGIIVVQIVAHGIMAAGEMAVATRSVLEAQISG